MAVAEISVKVQEHINYGMTLPRIPGWLPAICSSATSEICSKPKGQWLNYLLHKSITLNTMY